MSEMSCMKCRVFDFKESLCEDEFCKMYHGEGTDLDFINSVKASAQQWIPCSERLPDKDGIYLVTHRTFGKLEVTWNIFYGGEHASWLWNDEIIAWMPLPEPYKGEEA